ncbi:MAG TPA: 50S ribosomal protein L11 methyltransferase [Armatimonadota bacterium]|jgi:ribosomal protein L11 methyltransferase
MTNAFQMIRAHGPYPGRYLHIATGDGILVVDVQAAAEAIATSEGMPLAEAEECAAQASLGRLKKAAEAREFYMRLRSIPQWQQCPHGYPTMLPLSSAGPQRIGPFLVRAPWHPSEPGTLDILIEPGLAFGLGTHATTKLPMLQLAELLCYGSRVADVGCGSGVLSIAAARLGASRIQAVDRDEAAVAEARHNLKCNGVEADVHAGSAADLSGRFDLIVSNMGGAPSVVEIAPYVAAHLHPDGLFLASGIYGDTDEEAGAVANGVAAALAPFCLIEERRDMEHQCVGMVCRRIA